MESKPKLVTTPGDLRTIERFARNGRLDELQQYLKGLTDKVVKGEDHPPGEPGIIRSSPVIEAVRYGHLSVIRYLIKNFSNIVYDFGSPSGWQRQETAFHTAIRVAGHTMEILELLVEVGITVNCRDSLGRTPLHVATTYQRVKEANFLLDHGADVNAVDNHGLIPLLSVLENATGHVTDSGAIIQLLLDRGADITYVHLSVGNILHEIARSKKKATEVSQLLTALLQSQPDKVWMMMLNPSTDTEFSKPPALMYAVEEGNTPFVEFVVSHPQCPPAAAVDALLGLSTNAFPLSVTSTQTIANLWERAFQIQAKHGVSVKYLPPLQEYGNRVEINSFEKGQQLLSASDLKELQYQLVIMRERIFGCKSRAVFRYIKEFSSDLSSKGCFAEADMLLERAMEVIIASEHADTGIKQYYDDLTSFFEKRFLSGKGHEVTIQNLPLCARYGAKVASHLPGMSESSGLSNLLYLAISALGLWAYRETKLGSDTTEIDELGQKYFTKNSLVSLLRLIMGRPPEHVPTQEREAYVMFVVRALIRWAASAGQSESLYVNAVDSDGDRPLHVVMRAPRAVIHPLCVQLDVEDIPSLLIEHGAHLDAVNSEGKTAYEICFDLKVKEIIAPPPIPNLTCLACRAIVAGGIPYQNFTFMSPRLRRLIMLHDPNAERNRFKHRWFLFIPQQ